MLKIISFEKILFVISFEEREFIWRMVRRSVIEIKRKKKEKNRN